MGSEISALILDDDQYFAEEIAKYLKIYGIEATVANTVEDFDSLWGKKNYDIILLDILLEKTNGLNICRKIRSVSFVPIIFLSALGENIDVVAGLEVGADDYLVKPFSSRELLARIYTILRRVNETKQNDEESASPIRQKGCIHFGEWILDTKARLLIDNRGIGKSISFSLYIMLQYFLAHPNEAIDRDMLLQCLGTSNIDETFSHRLDVHIMRLRKILGNKPNGEQYIKTVRSIGYLFDVENIFFACKD